MKKVLKKAISVLLVLSIIFSVATVCVSAQQGTADEAVKALEKDIPIVEIPGFGESIYKGLSTETEDDDENIWDVSADKIMPIVNEHLVGLIVGMLTGNFEKLSDITTDVLLCLFGDAACDENGVPDPDTGIKSQNRVVAKSEYGQRNSYSFHYDWRLDMHTLASQLHEYIEKVMSVTGSDEVGLVAFSMGNCVMLTYLYEYYYTADAEERSHINSAVFLAGAMNGVACCEDPFSGNIVFDSTSVTRMLLNLISSNEDLRWLYNLLTVMYSFKMLEPIVNFTNKYVVGNLGEIADKALLSTVATIPGFYAMMSIDGYRATENFIFSSAEDKDKFSTLISKNRYYHDDVQANSDNIINSLMSDGKKVGIISEYGYSMIPVTSDNARMSDGVINTEYTSFGATCADVDCTLGDSYTQAVQCSCGGNHLSPDNQIDASTCKYPDITWFAKNLNHTSADRYFADMVDLITYSESQITVWTYPDMPQFMINQLDLTLVPMNVANAGKVVPFNETTSLKNLFKDLFKK